MKTESFQNDRPSERALRDLDIYLAHHGTVSRHRQACIDCGALLNHYNSGPRCLPCEREEEKRQLERRLKRFHPLDLGRVRNRHRLFSHFAK